MYFDPLYYISVDVFILCLQICSLTGNGLIIYLFFSNSRLKNQQQLGLILTLAIADFLFAASTIPYIVNFLIGWNTVELLYPGHFTVFLAQPLVIHFKINLLIATGIAVDRLQAMRWPIYYRSKNHKNFIATIVSIGIVLALIDVYIEYSLGISEQVPGCNTIGCFVSHAFRLYWGMSNMVLNFLMLILALIVIYNFNKLLRMKKNVVKVVPTTSTITNNGNGTKKEIMRTEEMKEKHNFNQTNRLSVCILIISIIFLLIPSIFVGAIDYFGMQTFERLGPFYLFGLLLAGVSNSCTYIIFHVEVKKAAFQLFGRIRKNDGNPLTRIISG